MTKNSFGWKFVVGFIVGVGMRLHDQEFHGWKIDVGSSGPAAEPVERIRLSWPQIGDANWTEEFCSIDAARPTVDLNKSVNALVQINGWQRGINRAKFLRPVRSHRSADRDNRILESALGAEDPRVRRCARTPIRMGYCGYRSAARRLSEFSVRLFMWARAAAQRSLRVALSRDALSAEASSASVWLSL